MTAPRRAREWADITVDSTLTVGTQTAIHLSSAILDDEKKGATVVRVIIDLEAVALTVGVGSVIALGLLMLDAEARAAGVGPDPQDDNDQPGWMWRTRKLVFLSALNDRSQTTKIFMDVRSMRKFPGPDVDLAMVWAVVSGGSSQVNLDGLIRVLWLKS